MNQTNAACEGIVAMATRALPSLAMVLVSLLAVRCWAADSVEFLNGTTLEGEILEIRKDEQEFDFRCKIAGKSVTQTYPYARVHAVTFKGNRFVITPKNPPEDSTESSRSPQDVLAFIEQQGSQPPSWLETTKLTHPKSLDLAWPLKAEGPWNESKNVGQYLWGRVNPNVSRWKSGTKLLYQCIELHQDDPALLRRDHQALGKLYFDLFQDYARAAFYLQKADVSANQMVGVHLAECYYRLGSKQLAMDTMRGKSLHFAAIKLLGEMGELEEALNVTEYYEKTNVCNEAWLNAGDALRAAGRLEEAVAFFQKILDRNRARNQQYLDRYKGRAQDSIDSIRLFDQADITQVTDGIYKDKAVGYNGDLYVQVTVQDAKILKVEVTQHKEKQFYAALTDTPQQIVDTQGIREIDGTSGATITSVAIVNATARALAQGASK